MGPSARSPILGWRSDLSSSHWQGERPGPAPPLAVQSLISYFQVSLDSSPHVYYCTGTGTSTLAGRCIATLWKLASHRRTNLIGLRASETGEATNSVRVGQQTGGAYLQPDHASELVSPILDY